jgi:hypothetical protein
MCEDQECIWDLKKQIYNFAGINFDLKYFSIIITTCCILHIFCITIEDVGINKDMTNPIVLKKNNSYKFLALSHNILEPTRGVTFFNSGFKSDPTELFPLIVQVIAGY